MIDILAAKVVPIEDVAMQLGLDVKRGAITCLNPEHPDRHPSMRVWKERNKFKCHACDASYDVIDIVQIVLGLEWHEAYNWVTGDQTFRSLTPVKIEQPDKEDQRFKKPPIPYSFFESYHAILDSSEDWLAHKGINAGKYGIRKIVAEAVQYIPVFKSHGLFIPYYQNSHITYGRWRNMTQKGDRYYAMPGMELRLYNQDVLAKLDGKKPLYLTEGETDTLSFDEMGRIALGFPGATAFRLIPMQLIPWLRSLGALVPEIILAFDNDSAGQKLDARVRSSLIEANITLPISTFDLGKYNDVNDWYLDHLK